MRTPANVRRVQDTLNKDRRGSVRDLANEIGIKKSSLHKILTKDLHFNKVSAKFVPRILTQEQKDFRVSMCQINLDRLKNDRYLLEKIICSDKSSIPIFDPETKQSSCQWKLPGEPRPTKALRGRAKRSSMLTAFFDGYGVIHQEFAPPRTTIRSEEYCEILDRLKEDIRRKRPGMWKGGRDGNTDRDFVLQHDNASCHTSVLTLAKIGESGIDLLSHPPYSPDLVPADYFLFPHLKSFLRGREFRNIPALQAEVRHLLLAMEPELFKSAILDMPRRWLKCIHNNGEYFEGHHVDVEDEYEQLDITWESSDEETESDTDSDE